MPKDSQPDNKVARMEKCNFQTPITSEEGKNHNRTAKKTFCKERRIPKSSHKLKYNLLY
ncbi:TPA: hypothetical protein ACOTFX_001306 [Clostridium perfringens]|uniref:hypothetical protein n=1 Tax=Clostridium perfringens TaxID=1502 RepID=UPI0013E91957|nr:hypothetical protein [Clostridium perfringens]